MQAVTRAILWIAFLTPMILVGAMILHTAPVPADELFAGFRAGVANAIDRGIASAATRLNSLSLHDLWVLIPAAIAYPSMRAIAARYGEPPRRRSLAPRSQPLPDLTPAEVGTLLDHRADPKDLAATLVDLAVRGYVLIEERQGGTRLRAGAPCYILHLRRQPDAWDDLQEFERAFLEVLFRAPAAPTKLSVQVAVHSVHAAMQELEASATLAARDENADFDRLHHDRAQSLLLSNPLSTRVDLSESREFARYAHLARTALFRRMIERGLYASRPNNQSAFFAIAMFLLLFISMMLVSYWSDQGGSGASMFVAMVLAVGVACTFRGRFGCRTAEGVRALEEVLAFREYISKIDEHQLRRSVAGAETFERCLPYAILMGKERRWARAFRSLCSVQPTWYRSEPGNQFDTVRFTRGLSGFVDHAALQTSPRSRRRVIWGW
jgi:hypothetical protein